MTPRQRLEAAPPEVREHVLALLDEMSAPLHPRVMERLLCQAGFTRSEARPIVSALKHLPIIVIGDGKLEKAI